MLFIPLENHEKSHDVLMPLGGIEMNYVVQPNFKDDL